MIFVNFFLLLEINENNNNNEKKNCIAERMGYCPIILKKKKKFVLQCRNCIARNKGEGCGLYCSLRGELYCNRLVYIAIEGG